MNDIVIADPLPDSHHPYEARRKCKQPWPCPDEQARADAALIADRFRDVPLNADENEGEQ